MSQILCEPGDVRITADELRVGDKWYLLSDIKSAKVRPKWDEGTGTRHYVFLIGRILAGAAAIGLVVRVLLPGVMPLAWSIDYLLPALVVGLLMSPVFWSRLVYAVRLEGVFGKGDIIISRDRGFAKEITNQINTALSKSRELAQ